MSRISELLGGSKFRSVSDFNSSHQSVVPSSKGSELIDNFGTNPCASADPSSSFLRRTSFSTSSAEASAFLDAGNTLEDAYNVGSLTSKPVSLIDRVSSSSSVDYYRFTLNTSGNFNLSLTGLTADADVQLLNTSGTVLNSSEQSRSLDEAINQALDPGTYFVKVYQFSGDTSYTLRLSATTPSSATSPSNLLPVEMNLGAISSIPRSTTNSLSNADTADVFSFDLNGPGSLTLTLTGLSADADVRLIRDFNNNGVVDDGEEIGRSQQNGTSNESISLPSLAAGRYLVQVYQYEGSTNYRLTLSTTPNGVLGSADNTLATANYIGVLNGSQTFNDFVGDADPNDYYHFILNSPSNFNLSLSGLSADADVQLIQDFNSNGVVDAGEVIAYPFQVGNQPESLDVNLEPGSYFVRVFQYSGDAVYTLSLSANPTTTLLSQTDVAEPDPGNTLETARNLGVLNGSQTINESVSSTDPNDYYRFTLNQSTGFSLSLTNLTSDADVQLLDSTGSLIASSFASGTSPESISRTLVAGTYYVRVYEYTGSTNYTLGLSTNVATQLSTYSPSYGYGLVDADAAVSQALGQPMFPSVPNLGGTGWGLDMINAPEVWAKGYTGQGITVAVVDSGVDYTHPDLDSNIWVNTREIPGNGIDDDGNGFVDDVRGWDFVDNDNTPTDLDGHGTHIAGTIAAENNGFGITGVAYNAHIMPVRVLDATGSGTYDNIAAGIRYAANNGANIINLSLGGPTASDQITSAIQYATQRGSLVVVAAGNGSGSQPMFPANLANLPGVLAVGSVNINKQLAASSNKAGSSVLSYVVAPGVSIYSTTPNNTYQYYSGTSMATPYVSGTAALILSANPKLTPAQVASLLTATANPSGITV